MDTHQHAPPSSPRTSEGQSRAKVSSGRPRGRPIGSKNKPKPPPMIIIRESPPNSFNSHLLQIPPNYDVGQALTDFATKRRRGICILSATGSVVNVALSQNPPPPPASQATLCIPTVMTLTGRFEILTLSGAILSPPAPPSASGLSVFLSIGQGQVMGGKVVGPLVAAETVTVSVSSFAVTNYERLPLVEETEEENKNRNAKIPTLIPQQTSNEMNPAIVATLFHDRRVDIDNVMRGEELWGAALWERPRPTF